MTVLITLTTAGTDSGPFNLYSDLDGYTSAFATGVSKSALVAGYSSSAVPDYTSIIRVLSTGVCTNYIDITLGTTTTTTSSSTSTTTTTVAPTTTTTTTGTPGPITVQNNAALAGPTINSLVPLISWTSFTLSNFPVQSEGDFITGTHSAFTGFLDVVCTVSIPSRVQISKNGVPYACTGDAGTGTVTYTFAGVNFLSSDVILITLEDGSTCP